MKIQYEYKEETIIMKMRFMLENCEDDNGTSSQMIPYRDTDISYLPCVETKERAPITAGRKNFMMVASWLSSVNLYSTVFYQKENRGGLIIMQRWDRMNEWDGIMSISLLPIIEEKPDFRRCRVDSISILYIGYIVLLSGCTFSPIRSNRSKFNIRS